jgi:hypothetical protein
MILVYQMAKVASIAWVEGARNQGLSSIHVHYLTDRSLSWLEELLLPNSPHDTIVNPLMLRHVVRSGRAAVAEVAAARARGEKIQVIAGMRDPVARSLSLLFFFADFCGHRNRRLNARSGAGPEDTCRFLRELWEDVLAGSMPAGRFERLLWFMMGSYRDWFPCELQAVFGLDIHSAGFAAGAGAQRLSGPDSDALVYRAEDIPVRAHGHGQLCNCADSFLGTTGWSFPEINSGRTRRSAALYELTLAQFRLPASMLDAIYGAESVTHFYQPAEIALFRDRWGQTVTS